MRFLHFMTNGRFSGFDEDVYHMVVAKDLEVNLVQRSTLKSEVSQRSVIKAKVVQKHILRCEVRTK